MLNEFRKNPKGFARHLENLKKYLDRKTNVLSEPGKIQVQMVEGEAVFSEAIEFLNSLPNLKPLEWDENLATSSMYHVMDIGPKGLLSYQSSDGTEPEERISRYGNYIDSLGENIDFGPNDCMGVIVSLTLDDGEPERPHRDNLFKTDYQKVGIACGPHKSEYQMCVMDFAYDFVGLEENEPMLTDGGLNTTVNDRNPSQGKNEKLPPQNGNRSNPVNNQNNFNDLDNFIDTHHQPLNETYSQNTLKKNSSNVPSGGSSSTNLMTGNSNNTAGNKHTPTANSNTNQSPLVRLSLDKEEYKNFKNQEVDDYTFNRKMTGNFGPGIGSNTLNPMNNAVNNNTLGNPNSGPNYNQNEEEFAMLGNQVRQINLEKKVVSKLVEVTTKIVYTYEDGSTKEVVEKQNHLYDFSR